MIELKLRRGTFQHVESELYAYHDTKNEIVRLKNEILHGSPKPYDNIGGSRSNVPSDPTGKTAVLMMSHRKIEQLEHIVEAIDSVLERLPVEKKKLIQLRYWDKSRNLTWDGVAMQLDVSRRTAMNWRNGIIYAIAEKIGWR